MYSPRLQRKKLDEQPEYQIPGGLKQAMGVLHSPDVPKRLRLLAVSARESRDSRGFTRLGKSPLAYLAKTLTNKNRKNAKERRFGALLALTGMERYREHFFLLICSFGGRTCNL